MIARLLRFLAHDPTTACQLETAAEHIRLRAEYDALLERVREAELELYMRTNAAALLAGLETTPIADRILFDRIAADWED